MKQLFWLLVVCGLLIQSAAAITVTASVTEHSIVWEWEPGTEYLVYVDGKHAMNTTMGRYHLSDLLPYQEHRIDLYLYDEDMAAVNTTAGLQSPDRFAVLQGTSGVTTLHSTTMLYFGILLISVFVLLSYIGRATVYGVIMATMSLTGSVMLISIVLAYSIFFVMIASMLLILSISVLVFDLYRLLIASDTGWYLT